MECAERFSGRRHHFFWSSTSLDLWAMKRTTFLSFTAVTTITIGLTEFLESRSTRLTRFVTHWRCIVYLLDERYQRSRDVTRRVGSRTESRCLLCILWWCATRGNTTALIGGHRTFVLSLCLWFHETKTGQLRTPRTSRNQYRYWSTAIQVVQSPNESLPTAHQFIHSSYTTSQYTIAKKQCHQNQYQTGSTHQHNANPTKPPTNSPSTLS